MDNSELESFLTKFRCLWNFGFDAHLELDSHAGQAWVSLRVRLGHAPGPLQPPNHFPHPHQDNAVGQEGLLQEQNNLKMNMLRK